MMLIIKLNGNLKLLYKFYSITLNQIVTNMFRFYFFNYHLAIHFAILYKNYFTTQYFGLVMQELMRYVPLKQKDTVLYSTNNKYNKKFDSTTSVPCKEHMPLPKCKIVTFARSVCAQRG